MQIVAVQLDMAWEDKSVNHSRVRELLAEAQPASGSLIVLPEMYETGFTMNVRAAAQSPSRDGELLLKELAAQYNACVMGGVVAPIDADDSSQDVELKSRNEAVVFAPDGTELARYQKMQPFSLSGEDSYYPPGNSICTFEWQGVRIAPFICYDLRFPELFRDAVREGAEMLTLIACWPARRSEHWVRLLQARAIENLCPVVGVNRCGAEPGLTFDGRTSAFDHMGNSLFEASSQEQVLTTTIDIAAARDWRQQFPALRDMRSLEVR